MGIGRERTSSQTMQMRSAWACPCFSFLSGSFPCKMTPLQPVQARTVVELVTLQSSRFHQATRPIRVASLNPPPLVYTEQFQRARTQGRVVPSTPPLGSHCSSIAPLLIVPLHALRACASAHPREAVPRGRFPRPACVPQAATVSCRRAPRATARHCRMCPAVRPRAHACTHHALYQNCCVSPHLHPPLPSNPGI